MDLLTAKFRQSTRCEKCIEHFDPMDGCMFKCGHVFHTRCILENRCCFICNQPYNPEEIYQLSKKFMDKLVIDETLSLQQRKHIIKKTCNLMIEAALLDHIEAQFTIGVDSLSNDYIKSMISKDDVFFWINKASHNNHVKATLGLMKYYKSKDEKLYYKYAEIAANQNEVTCQLLVAIHFEKTNPEKCLKYMNMAVKNNSICAHKYMYYYYTEGIIVPRNIQTGYDYLSKVAAGDTTGECQYEMAEYYKDRDSKTALYWCKLSVDQGYQPAQIELANHYLLNKEYTNAYKLLNKNQSDPWAMYLLGYYYETYKESYTDAFHWYTKSANKHVDHAQYKLYYFYENGLGVEKDLDKSFDYLVLAANNNICECQVALAQRYEIGFNYKGHFIQSDKKAKKYYKLAKEQGNTFSVNALSFYTLFDTMK